MAKKFTFNGREITITPSTYRTNDSLALIAKYKSGGEDVLTVNLPDSFVQSDSYVFLDTNNISWVEEFIKQSGIGIPTGLSQQSGFCSYPLYYISPETLKSLRGRK